MRKVDFTEDLLGKIAQQTNLKYFTRNFVLPALSEYNATGVFDFVFPVLSYIQNYRLPSLLVCTTLASLSAFAPKFTCVLHATENFSFLEASSANIFAYLNLPFGLFLCENYISLCVWSNGMETVEVTEDVGSEVILPSGFLLRQLPRTNQL